MIFEITHKHNGFNIKGNAPHRLSIHGYTLIKEGHRFYVEAPGNIRIAKDIISKFPVTKAQLLHKLENWFYEPSPSDVRKYAYLFFAENLQKQLEKNPEALRSLFLDLLWDLKAKKIDQ